MKELVVAAMVVTLGACSKSDDVRDSVATPKAAAAATKSSATLEAGVASELPNSVEPGDSPLGGGIKH
jgi:hypothetical protein